MIQNVDSLVPQRPLRRLLSRCLTPADFMMLPTLALLLVALGGLF